MNKDRWYRDFLDIVDGEDILINEPMSKHTSFKIGGPVDFFLTPRSIKQLQLLVNYCRDNEVPHYIIGNGSNLLVRDGGFSGVIIQIYKNLSSVKIDNDKVFAEAGILLSTLAKKICKASLKGFEFASGIPGTLGGAVCMNAGAYGGELKQILVSATVINDKGDLVTLSNEKLELGYRTSIIQKNGYIVVSATLELEKGNQENIQDHINELTNKRKTKQPLELPSAGSAFKRPIGYFAGKLIMDSGLKGYKIGDAQVSEKHCGFIVNTGNATAKDVVLLMQHIQETVKDKFGVNLEPEVRIIGFDN
ncbi:MAG: UDP-N-acetylmuramate dehydrogenase [Eubacteriales bacterium]